LFSVLEKLLESLELFLELLSLGSKEIGLLEINGELLDDLLFLLEELLESLNLLSEVLDLAFKSWDGANLRVEFTNLLLEGSNFLFVSRDLSAHEFDLLSEVNELLFKGLFFSTSGVEVIKVL